MKYCIDYMDGHLFEFFCAEVLKYNGYHHVKVTKGSGDQGVDILAVKDGLRYSIQCKNYSSPLGNKPVQEINAGRMFYHCDVGIVMTNSHFTPSAYSLAKVTDVQLWDGNTIYRMMKNVPEYILQKYCLYQEGIGGAVKHQSSSYGYILAKMFEIVFFIGAGVFAIAAISMFPGLFLMVIIFGFIAIILDVLRRKLK